MHPNRPPGIVPGMRSTFVFLGALLVASCGSGADPDRWQVRDRDEGAIAQKTSRDGVGYLALICERGRPLGVQIAAPVNVAAAGRRDPQPRTIHYRIDGGAEKAADVQVLEDLIHFDGPAILTELAPASRLDLRTETAGGGNLAITVDLAGLPEARGEVERKCRG